MMKRQTWKFVLTAALLVFSIVSCDFGGSDFNAGSATLVVTTDIPSGAAPQILIFGPNGFFYQSKDSEKVELQNLKPGIYKLIAFGLIDDDIVYIPQYNSVLLQLEENKATILNLVYQESGSASVNPISNIHVLDSTAIIDVGADYVDLVPNYPTSNLSTGQVIIAGPLAIYENGFLREVIGIEQRSDVVHVYTQDVDFAYVFPDADIEIGKVVSDYEIAAALAIYDINEKAFNLDNLYAVFSSDDASANPMSVQDLPVVGPWSLVAPLGDSAIARFEKEFCASEALDPRIREAVYSLGLDPCVYTEGQFYISTHLITNGGVPTAAGANIISSWPASVSWSDGVPYDGPVFGFKIKTKSYKSSYSGEIPLPEIPVAVVPLVVGGVPITISSSLQPKLQAGLAVSGQGASVLENGLTLVDYFTRLKGWFYVAGDSLSEDATRLDPSLKITNNLSFDEPEHQFLVDADGDKLDSFTVSGNLRTQLELQLGIYDSPKRNVGGFAFLGFGAQLGMTLDALCASDPWWSFKFEPYVIGGISLEALRKDYGIASKSYTLSLIEYAAEPVISINPSALSLAKGEVWQGFLQVNGPSHCIGQELNVSFDENGPLELLGLSKTIPLPVSDWLTYEDNILFKSLDDASEGSYTAVLRVIGDRGAWLAPFTRELPVNVIIEPNAGFYVNLLPSEITGSAGSYVTSTLYVSTRDGFRGEVDLTLKDATGEQINGVSILPKQVNVTDDMNNFSVNFLISSNLTSGTVEFYIWATGLYNGEQITKVTPVTLHIE